MINLKTHITKEDYIKLREDANWHPLDDNQIDNIINNSEYIISFYNDDEIAGMIRCISDKGYIYLMCDCIVMSKYQGMGLGKKIVNAMLEYIENNNKNKYVRVYIMSLKGKEEFYKSCGLSLDEATGLTKIFNE